MRLVEESRRDKPGAASCDQTTRGKSTAPTRVDNRGQSLLASATLINDSVFSFAIYLADPESNSAGCGVTV
jgi:hypothetical protein